MRGTKARALRRITESQTHAERPKQVRHMKTVLVKVPDYSLPLGDDGKVQTYTVSYPRFTVSCEFGGKRRLYQFLKRELA